MRSRHVAVTFHNGSASRMSKFAAIFMKTEAVISPASTNLRLFHIFFYLKSFFAQYIIVLFAFEGHAFVSTF